MEHAADLRATDADRAAVVEALRDAGADGRLDVDELEERVGQAHGAKTHGELAALTADLGGHALPAAVGAASGPLPATTGPRRELAVLGDVVVDLRASREPVLELKATAILGDVTVLVPPGSQVELVGGAAVLGDRKVDVEPAAQPGPRVRVHALAILGDVRIRTTTRGKAGWWRRHLGGHGARHLPEPPAPPPPPPPSPHR
ncbi:DUF1707 domain-containing protein [Conexibacter sp. SYSU D00693]|uniref:DUF1707 SHOCT-like domain-containing protein n=1 Tax=Conexibacter sp. SYSU D00693 TaxID=2812560 RepID=UPI00196A6115|nr:DUF1707 domain-containing protein [Conexibacter sp. SYSU D00693]